MNEIILQTVTSSAAEQLTKLCLDGGFKATSAVIQYSLHKGLPPITDFASYPLLLEGFVGYTKTTIRVYGIAAGYCGEGPNTLARILDAAGMSFRTEDIVTNKCADKYGNIRITLHR